LFLIFTCIGNLSPPLQLVVCLCPWISSESPVREHVGGLEFSSVLLTLGLLIGALKACTFILIFESCALTAL